MPATDAASDRRATAFTELGVTGLQRSGGVVREEFLPELTGPRAYKAFREMANNDPVVGACLLFIRLMMRGVEWRVKPARELPEAAPAAEFVTQCFEDMDQPLADVIDEVLSFVPFGFAPLEVTYKRRLGLGAAEPVHRSKHADGRIGWRRMALRSQDTVQEWLFDDATGDVLGLVQAAPPDYRRRVIPMHKLLLFRAEAHKGNPEGRSILRAAYRPWYFKRQIENMEGVGIERDFAGVPVAHVPEEILDENAPPEVQQRRGVFERLVTQLRNNEQAGLLFPLAYHPGTSNPVYRLELMGTGARRLFDTSAIIDRYNRTISMALLADFILLGHEKVGSFALSSSKTHMFGVALGAWLDSIAAVFNRHAVPALLELNPEFPPELPPRLWHSDVEVPDLAVLSQFLSAASAAGMPLFPDADLEAALRRYAGLPPAPEAGSDLDAGAVDDEPEPETPTAPPAGGNGARSSSPAQPVPSPAASVPGGS